MEIHFLSPGNPDERTGGHIYNRRVLQALAERGCHVRHQSLPGNYPEPDEAACATARACLAELPDRAVVVIDGLALGGLPEVVEAEADRLCIVALMHLPLAAETGIEADRLHARRRAEDRALACCRRIIANSGFTRNALIARGYPPERVDVAPPGTDPAPLARGSGDPDCLQLICVAALTPRKGHDLLIDALAGLADLAWHCRLVGALDRDPAHVDRIRRAIADADLTQRIEFTGELAGAELEAAWDSADLAVLASRYEGFGMVITEAVARGLPVVATAGGAVAEALPPGTGVLAVAGDTAALRAALFEVMHDATLRGQLAAEARRVRTGLADWPATAARFHAALGKAAP